MGEFTGLCPGQLTELEAFDTMEPFSDMSPVPVAAMFYFPFSIFCPVCNYEHQGGRFIPRFDSVEC